MTKLNLLFSEAIPNVHDHTLSVKSTKIKRKYEKNGMRRKERRNNPKKENNINLVRRIRKWTTYEWMNGPASMN